MKNMIIAIFACFAIVGCARDASVASHNLSKAADSFQLERRVVFYNGINGEYMLSIEGLCSVSPKTSQVDVTCKVGPTEFKKHSLGLSDNVTFFSEQLGMATVGIYHYEVVFKPQSILPKVDFRSSVTD